MFITDVSPNVHSFNLYNTGLYTRINSGSCDRHGMHTITSMDQCEAALKDLGLGDTLRESGSFSTLPYGCIFSPEDNYCVWNSRDLHVPCGGGSVWWNIYDCICSHVGMNLQFNYWPFIAQY